MPRKLLALLTAVVLTAAACGGSDEPDADVTESADDGAGGSALDLKATDFAFDPDTLEVEPGAEVEVTFVNGGSVSHTFTAEDLGVDVEAAGGEEVTATFTAPDEDTSVEFVCRFHSDQMQGTITVGAGGSGSGGTSEDQGSEDYDY